MISSDHGEMLGELNVYCDHQTADEHTAHVPLILKWPGLAARRLRAPHYQIDVTASLLELLGQTVPERWDGQSFATHLKAGTDRGRDHLVLSQGAWTCQRSVRYDHWLLISTLHDGYHLFDDLMLFDLRGDPHEQNNLAAEHPEVVAHALRLLGEWQQQMIPHVARGRDPLVNVMLEGGPYHTRGELPAYLERLRATGRADKAKQLAAKYPQASSA